MAGIDRIVAAANRRRGINRERAITVFRQPSVLVTGTSINASSKPPVVGPKGSTVTIGATPLLSSVKWRSIRAAEIPTRGGGSVVDIAKTQVADRYGQVHVDTEVAAKSKVPKSAVAPAAFGTPALQLPEVW